MKRLHVKKAFFLFLLVLIFFVMPSFAVTSKITRQSSAEDFLKGETEKTIVDSAGTITLARRAVELNCGSLLDDVWSVNSVVTSSDGTVYLGTSPNGLIIKYSNGKAEAIYSAAQMGGGSFAKKANGDSNSVDAEAPFANRHVFAMANDIGGRLLAGVSGEDSLLLRYDNGRIKTLFKPSGAKYIFAITVDEIGNIYLGTGPEGKIYRLNPFGKDPKLVCRLKDKNVLSLAVLGDFLYAGCDKRGLVYKIDLADSNVTVIYDSEQAEITSLLFDDDGYLYAAGASAAAVKDQKTSISSFMEDVTSGRPDTDSEKEKDEGEDTSGSTTMSVANTKDTNSGSKSSGSAKTKRGKLPKSAGHIYRIDQQGFVTDIFSEMAVFFAMALQGDKLFIGTGNNAQLFSVELDTEEKAVAYEDSQASQVSAVSLMGDDIYMGTSNPAKLIKLSMNFESQGTYTSDLIDASQPAKWGKLQVDADIPAGAKIFLSARSSNVKDPNDPAFSPWSKAVQLNAATSLDCPVGRFCQYKLTLKTANVSETPAIREVALSHVVPNLPPKVLSVSATRYTEKSKKGKFKISYKARDENKDKLVYTLEFRKPGRSRWIELKDRLYETTFQWDTRTVEDGRYEIKVIADDRADNTAMTRLSGSRISEPFVVDNTPPAIKDEEIRILGQNVTVSFTVKDELTVVGKVSYTVDSNKDWMGALPLDSVYDTTEENFKILIEDLEEGEHIIALKISDDLDNTMYKTIEVDIAADHKR